MSINPISAELDEPFTYDEIKKDAFRKSYLQFPNRKAAALHWINEISNKTKQKVKADLTYALNKGEIILGYPDRYFETDPVTLNVTSRICILITAKLAGSGKTVFGGNLMEQLMNTIDSHSILFDSKPEFGERRNPNKDPNMVEKLRRINQQIPSIYPRGWKNLISVIPQFILKTQGNHDFEGKDFRYDLNEMEFSDILTLFNVSQHNKGQNHTLNKLRRIIYGFESDEKLEEALLDGTLEDKEILSSHEVLKALTEGEVRDESIKGELYSMLQAKVIGKSTNFNIVDLINKGYHIQYITKSATDLDLRNKLLAYLSVELKRITRARYNYVRPEFAQGPMKIKKPIIFYFSEFDTIFPRDPLKPETKYIIQRIYDQDRYQNISIIADTAGIRNVHIVAIKQSDYIFTFKLDGRDMKYLIDERNISWDQEQQILKLEADKSNPPFECAVLPSNQNNHELLQTFFPLPPMSSIQKEQEVKTILETF